MNSTLLRRSTLAFTTATALLVTFHATAQSSSGSADNRKLAEWTVMIFMNGDNNLEEDALSNFADIAKVGSTDKVNVVVQFDRNGNYAETNPQWTQTLRFLVRKGMDPTPATAVQDIGEADMGDGAVLKEFVEWAKAAYPARHYLLDIWDHGQGWRALRGTSIPQFRSLAPAQIHPAATFRSISMDDTNDDQLYNRKIQDALTGANLDVIGFDACLMSMIETAYAMRGVAHVMVASEEEEPGTGWKYDDWLQTLEDNPGADAAALGAVLVNSYKKTYGDQQETTLSAVDLSRAEDLAASVSTLGKILETELRHNPKPVISARAKCLVYAPNAYGDNIEYFQHIDLGQFCDQVAGLDKNKAVHDAAVTVRSKLKKSISANYASKLRQGNFGSTGVAIYFPRTGALYKNDRFEGGGYRKDNKIFPVEFVQRFHWADFLHTYFEKVPN